MAEVYAEWDLGLVTIRKDTRVYFKPSTPPGSYQQRQGNCVGIVWMCNPGTLKWKPKPKRLPAVVHWGLWPKATAAIPGRPVLDPTTEVVVGILDDAQAMATASGRGAQAGDFVQVLNLFYVCDSTVSTARKTHSSFPGPHYTEAPIKSARFTWIAWGGGKGGRASCWLPRAILSASCNHFFYSGLASCRKIGAPSAPDYPVHPGVPRKHRFCDFTNYDSEIAREMANYI